MLTFVAADVPAHRESPTVRNPCCRARYNTRIKTEAFDALLLRNDAALFTAGSFEAALAYRQTAATK